ncbi:MAG: hypothetical protein JWN76_24 [Chitinophagaceae bacterium]|nr:hypothetical protein [Chitinophagaceae bacterium]
MITWIEFFIGIGGLTLSYCTVIAKIFYSQELLLKWRALFGSKNQRKE